MRLKVLKTLFACCCKNNHFKYSNIIYFNNFWPVVIWAFIGYLYLIMAAVASVLNCMPFSVKNHGWLDLGFKRAPIEFHGKHYLSENVPPWLKLPFKQICVNTSIFHLYVKQHSCAYVKWLYLICSDPYLSSHPRFKLLIPNNFLKHRPMAVALLATLKCYVLDEEALRGNFNIIHYNLKQHYTTVQALLITDCRRSYGRYTTQHNVFTCIPLHNILHNSMNQELWMGLRRQLKKKQM